VLPAALTLAAIGGIVAAGGFGYRWLTGSPRFAVAAIEVHGAPGRAQEEIERLVAPALGENLFRLSLGSIERRLRAESWLADATVRRSLPNRLVVDVAPRRPVAVVELGGLYLVDRDGRAFRRADVARGDADRLPIVTGIERDAYRRAPLEAAARVREALAAAAVFAESKGRPSIGEIHCDGRGGVTLFLRRPVVALHVGRAPDAGALRRRYAAFDSAWAALAPDERAAAATFHLDRDGSPARVTVAFTER
jgi:cell division protein FtsQ